MMQWSTFKFINESLTRQAFYPLTLDPSPPRCARWRGELVFLSSVISPNGWSILEMKKPDYPAFIRWLGVANLIWWCIQESLNWSAKKWSILIRPSISLFLDKIKQKRSVSSWIYHVYSHSRQINHKSVLTDQTDPSPLHRAPRGGEGWGEGVKNRSLSRHSLMMY